MSVYGILLLCVWRFHRAGGLPVLAGEGGAGAVQGVPASAFQGA